MNNQNIITKALNKYLISPITDKVAEEYKKSQELQKQDKNKQTLQAFANNMTYLNAKAGSNIKDKPEGTISSSVLREFSINYPIARACIDYLKTKVTQLDWDITVFDEEIDEPNPTVTRELKQFFRRPSGAGSSFRELQEKVIEDYLVLGTVAIERGRTRGGDLLRLLPVDSGTIKVRVNSSGRVPQPPEIAYEQWIRGQKTAELTTDDLIFEIRNARANSPFGLSPLESLIIQVQSALAGSLYNYRFFTDSNLAEGFVELPTDWTNDQVKEFQTHFDRMLSGDPRMQRKLKFMPGGVKYTPTKKPEEMAFEKFELWLLQQTCAVFGVPPQDIGFTHQINKSSAEQQSEKGEERAKRPIINFLSELYTDVIQNDLGYPNLAFRFMNVDPVDKEQEARVDDIRIRTGILSVDEVRMRDGLSEIGLGHYVMTASGPIPIDRIGVEPEVKEVNEEPEIEETEKVDLQRNEIKKWRRASLNDLRQGKPFRDFETHYIEDEIAKDINELLQEAQDSDDVERVFDIYLNGNYESIRKLKKLSNELQKYL